MTHELAVQIESAEVICGFVEGRCRCALAPHNDAVHRCACGGSWEVKDDGTFVILALPGSGEAWEGPGPDDYLPIVSAIFGW